MSTLQVVPRPDPMKWWICVSPSCEFIWKAAEKPIECPVCGFNWVAEKIGVWGEVQP